MCWRAFSHFPLFFWLVLCSSIYLVHARSESSNYLPLCAHLLFHQSHSHQKSCTHKNKNLWKGKEMTSNLRKPVGGEWLIESTLKYLSDLQDVHSVRTVFWSYHLGKDSTYLDFFYSFIEYYWLLISYRIIRWLVKDTCEIYTCIYTHWGYDTFNDTFLIKITMDNAYLVLSI